jgi:hypothetical protein
MDEGLTEKQVLERLCYYDHRNPYWFGEYDSEGDEREPREQCACDNCYYGRDKLALEILRLRALLESTRA